MISISWFNFKTEIVVILQLSVFLFQQYARHAGFALAMVLRLVSHVFRAFGTDSVVVLVLFYDELYMLILF